MLTIYPPVLRKHLLIRFGLVSFSLMSLQEYTTEQSALRLSTHPALSFVISPHSSLPSSPDAFSPFADSYHLYNLFRGPHL